MSGTPVSLPLIVYHGVNPGPTVWINAAIHGDEIGGIEIIRQTLEQLDPGTMAGTLIAMPIVNVHGFNNSDRYLPDRRDLNRSFPGTARGSLAGRIAHLMMTEVVSRCSVGIDLHTGSDHRTNLAQIRGDMDDPDTVALATAFGAPVTIHSRNRSGSLRHAATKAGVTVLLYEGGEALRFDRAAIAIGTSGIVRVLGHLGMVQGEDGGEAPPSPFSRKTSWVRASRSGILHQSCELGESVRKGQTLATVLDPFGELLSRLRAPTDGVIIGQTQYPLVNKGDAAVHVARLEPVTPSVSPAG